MSLAAIHIIKKELKLTDAAYRAVLKDVAGVTSAKLLDDEQDRAVMRRLYAMRDDLRSEAQSRPKTPAESKIWALWYELKGYLPEPERTAEYLCGIVRRASGNQNIREAADLGSLSRQEAYHTIEAFKRRVEQERASVAQEVPF